MVIPDSAVTISFFVSNLIFVNFFISTTIELFGIHAPTTLFPFPLGTMFSDFKIISLTL